MSRNELNNQLDTREEKVMQQRLSGPAMFIKTLAWVFAICLIAQAFLAGLAVFSDSARWTEHSRFADGFAVLPLLMLVIAMVAKQPAAIRTPMCGVGWHDRSDVSQRNLFRADRLARRDSPGHRCLFILSDDGSDSDCRDNPLTK